MNLENYEKAGDDLLDCWQAIGRAQQAARLYAFEGRWDLCRAQLDLVATYSEALKGHAQNCLAAAQDPPEVLPCLLS